MDAWTLVRLWIAFVVLLVAGALVWRARRRQRDLDDMDARVLSAIAQRRAALGPALRKRYTPIPPREHRHPPDGAPLPGWDHRR